MQAKSRAFATEQIGQQREDFKRLGVLGDWERPYKTMDPANEAGETPRFQACDRARLCLPRPEARVLVLRLRLQSLAEFEIEYADKKSDTLDVAFESNRRRRQAGRSLWPRRPARREHICKAFAVIWTTTAWTIPANQALERPPRAQLRAGGRTDKALFGAGRKHWSKNAWSAYKPAPAPCMATAKGEKLRWTELPPPAVRHGYPKHRLWLQTSCRRVYLADYVTRWRRYRHRALGTGLRRG